MSSDLPNVVFVLGGPGAGKGTQCVKVVEVIDNFCATFEYFIKIFFCSIKGFRLCSFICW